MTHTTHTQRTHARICVPITLEHHTLHAETQTGHTQIQVHQDTRQAVPHPRIPENTHEDQGEKEGEDGQCSHCTQTRAPSNTPRPPAFPIKYAPWIGTIPSADLPKSPPGRTARYRPSVADPKPQI